MTDGGRRFFHGHKADYIVILERNRGPNRQYFMEMDDKKQQFTKIYEEEVDAVFRYTLSRVADREEVLDIVQETFSKFWQSLSGDVLIKHPRPFIFTVARNKIIDWYRKKKPQSLEAMSENEDDSPFQIPDEKIYEDIKLSAEASIILKAINKLSSSYREVIYWRFVEDLTPSEIAEILNITPNAVSVRINRGVEELRNNLKIK